MWHGPPSPSVLVSCMLLFGRCQSADLATPPMLSVEGEVFVGPEVSHVVLGIRHRFERQTPVQIVAEGCAVAGRLELFPETTARLVLELPELPAREEGEPLLQSFALALTAPGGERADYAGHRTDLVGWIDLRLLDGDGSYQGRAFRWAGEKPIEVQLDPRRGGASPPVGKRLELIFLWGAKRDVRAGDLRLSTGDTIFPEHGGHDGFRWARLTLPERFSREPTIGLTLSPRLGYQPPFVAAVGLRVAP